MAELTAECNRESRGICVPRGFGRENRAPTCAALASAPRECLHAGSAQVRDERGSMPKSPEALFQFLEDLGIEVTTRRHPPLFTVEESQSLRGEIPGAHTKNLFLKDKKDRYFLVTVEESAQVDLKSLHHIIGASGRVSFGKPDKLME